MIVEKLPKSYKNIIFQVRFENMKGIWVKSATVQRRRTIVKLPRLPMLPTEKLLNKYPIMIFRGKPLPSTFTFTAVLIGVTAMSKFL